jgi:hypothetical protein
MKNKVRLMFALDVEQVTAGIEEKSGLLADMLAERIDRVNAMMAERVKGNLSGAVLNEQSGKLLSTVQQVPTQRSGDELYGSVVAGGPEAPYGIYFEEGGLGYYTIAAVNARALAFMMGGNLVFAKLVNHPPIPKLPWFAPEVLTAMEQMPQALRQVISEVLEPRSK